MAGKGLVLSVKVVGGSGLASCDANGLSDPYVRLTVGKKRAKTRVAKKTLDPQWNEEFCFGPVEGGVEIKLECWDWDKMSSDDFMGKAHCVLLGDQFKEGVITLDLQLLGRGRADEKVSGTITLQMRLDTQTTEEMEMAMKKSSSFLSGKLRRNTATRIKESSLKPRADQQAPAEAAAEDTGPERSHPVFGIELADLMDVQRTSHPDLQIPYFVHLLLQWLRSHKVQDSVGAFRVGGKSSVMKQLRSKMESAPLTKDTFPSDVSIHNITGLLKAFLRELPTPVMTFEMFTVVFNEAEPEAVPPLHTVLAALESIPKANICLLAAVLRIAREVADNAVVNRMDAQNLAIVLGPNLLWKKQEEDTMESLLNYRASLTIITSVTQEMIEKFNFIPLLVENSAVPETPVLSEEFLGVPAGGRARRARGSFEGAAPPPPVSLEQIDPKDLYDSFDTDGSGALDAVEFGIFYKDLVECTGKPCPTNKEIMAAVNAVDEDGDGEITFEEFNAWWKSQQ